MGARDGGVMGAYRDAIGGAIDQAFTPEQREPAMTELNITEAGSVQFPMVRHAVEIGWTPLSPKDALAMRGGEAGLLFRGVLEEALRRFNVWMTDDAVRSVVENLQALPPTIEGNRQALAWLRGERQWYDEAEQRHRQVRLIDFDDP